MLSSKEYDPNEKGTPAIQDFQYHLVLLHHASTCTFSNSNPPQLCRAFQLCSATWELLQHVKSCPQNQGCPYEHCCSTKYLLTHNRDCRSSACEVCQPLKEVLARKARRTKQIVNVKRKRCEVFGEEDQVSDGDEENANAMRSPRSLVDRLSYSLGYSVSLSFKFSFPSSCCSYRFYE
jgi:hypothetical protein